MEKNKDLEKCIWLLSKHIVKDKDNTTINKCDDCKGYRLDCPTYSTKENFKQLYKDSLIVLEGYEMN